MKWFGGDKATSACHQLCSVTGDWDHSGLTGRFLGSHLQWGALVPTNNGTTTGDKDKQDICRVVHPTLECVQDRTGLRPDLHLYSFVLVKGAWLYGEGHGTVTGARQITERNEFSQGTGLVQTSLQALPCLPHLPKGSLDMLCALNNSTKTYPKFPPEVLLGNPTSLWAGLEPAPWAALPVPSGVSLCDPHPQVIPLARCRVVGEVPAGNLALDFLFCFVFICKSTNLY